MGRTLPTANRSLPICRQDGPGACLPQRKVPVYLNPRSILIADYGVSGRIVPIDSRPKSGGRYRCSATPVKYTRTGIMSTGHTAQARVRAERIRAPWSRSRELLARCLLSRHCTVPVCSLSYAVQYPSLSPPEPRTGSRFEFPGRRHSQLPSRGCFETVRNRTVRGKRNILTGMVGTMHYMLISGILLRPAELLG